MVRKEARAGGDGDDRRVGLKISGAEDLPGRLARGVGRLDRAADRGGTGSSGASRANRAARSAVRFSEASSSTLVDADARRRPIVTVTTTDVFAS
jgi:hypothetical protein